MSCLLWAMGILGAGVVWAMLLARFRRLALAGSLLCMAAAGGVTVAGAASFLLGSVQTTAAIAWTMPIASVRLALDGVSAWFLLAAGLLSSAAAIYSWGYLQEELGTGHRTAGSSLSVPVYSALICLLVAALLIVFTAADAVLFLVGWELMSLAGFFLVLFHDRNSETRRGAWIYLIATHLGTAACLFPMFAMLIARSGDSQFASFAAAMAAAPRELAAVLFVLGLIGFGTKAGFMPMHVWLPHAHPVAPSPVSALLSGIVIKSGIYGLLRLLSWLPALPAWCAVLMLLVGATTGIMGILYALSQHQLKRLLAYSSVENIGIIGIGLGIGMLGQTTNRPELAALGFAGAMLHVLNHALFKGLLFLSAGTVLHGTATAALERLGGLAKRTPANAALFLLGAVAICALPPLNGFLSEWLIYKALFGGAVAQQGWSSIAVLALTALALIGGLALACFAKAFGVIFLGEPREPRIHVHPTPRTMLAGQALLAGMCLVIGLGGIGLIEPLARAQQILLPGAGGIDATLRQAAQPLVTVAAVLGILIGLILTLMLLKTNLPVRRQTAGGVSTWGCGYPFPAARMQYTGSSFARSLGHAFRHLLRPQTRLQRPLGYFPASGMLSTNTPDIAETRAFGPLFSALRQGFQRLWPLQHGRIQLYLIYIVAALVIVFIVEAYWAPYSTSTDGTGPHRISAMHTDGGHP